MVWDKAAKASLPKIISSHLMPTIDFRDMIFPTHTKKSLGSPRIKQAKNSP